MPEALSVPQKAARVGANALPVYRIARGFQTAHRLRTDMADPADRTWGFASRVAFDAGTDIVDGWLARYAGPTRLGGWLDQMADKIWADRIICQFVENGELERFHRDIILGRDALTTGVRVVRNGLGLRTDADVSGKIKMGVITGAIVAECSPLAEEYPAFPRALFDIGTAASIGSGLEIVRGFARDIPTLDIPGPARLAIAHSMTEIEQIAA